MATASADLPALTFFPLHAIVWPSDGSPAKCGCDRPPGECAQRTVVGAHPAVNYSNLTPGQSVPSHSGRYGLATGGRFGLVGIDIDRKDGKDGYPAWLAIASQLGLPPTRVIETPSGGYHVLYRVPIGTVIQSTRSVLAPGVDIRGDGGYLVAEGTSYRTGPDKLYRVVHDVPPVMAPENLLQLLSTTVTSRFVSGAAENMPDGIEWSADEMASRRAEFRKACLEMPEAIDGQGGHDATLRVAICGAKHWALPEAIVSAEMLAHYNPRCVPPWPAADIIRKVNQARFHSYAPLGTAAPAGWDEAMAAAVAHNEAERAKPVPPVELPPLAPTQTVASSRRVRAVGEPHRYEFEPSLLDNPAKSRGTNILEVAGILARHPTWAGVFQFDAFQMRIIAVKPPCALRCEDPGIGLAKTDVSAVRCWLQHQGLKASYDTTEHAIHLAARGCAVDTLRDWAEGLAPMGEVEARGVIRELVVRGLGAPNSVGGELFVTRHLVGGIRRAMVPGWKHDHVLILAGDKSLGKTSTLQELFNPHWFRQQMPSLRERDGSHALMGFHGVSFDEMSNVMREEFQVVRDFITRPYDTFRDFGSGDLVRAQRRCILWGTTNPDSELIRDPETDRRWLILHCSQRLDIDWVRTNRERVWRAAKALMMLGEASHLSETESAQYLAISQAQYLAHEETEGEVERFIAQLSEPQRRAGFSLYDAYKFLYGGFDPPEKTLLAFERDVKIKRALTKSLRRMGLRDSVGHAGSGGRAANRLWT